MTSANLAALPPQITLRIINLVLDRGNTRQGACPNLAGWIPKGQSLRTIQSLRLTCRELSQWVTPMLFPILHVSIHSKSIDAFEKLSRNRAIAINAHNVVVNLATYPSDMALNLGTFIEKRFNEYDQRFRVLGFEPSDDGEGMEEGYRIRKAHRLLKHEWHLLAAANCDKNGGREAPEATNGARVGKYGQVLLRSYEEFAKRHGEQLKCLSDTEAMEKLAMACSRLSNGGKIRFSTDTRRYSGCGRADELDDPELLYRGLVEPYSWETIQSEGKEVDLDMVKMLSRLPLALAYADVPLTELHLDCFPLFSGFTQLLFHETQRASELEINLRLAFEHLRVFFFGFDSMTRRVPRHKPLSESDLSHMRAYPQAALATTKLQHLYLQFNAYSIIPARNYLCLMRPALKAVDAKFDELKPFFSQLSPEIRSLELDGVRLLDGQWVPLLDVAHESTAQRGRKDLCRASLSRLLGGEFGKEMSANHRPFNVDSNGWPVKPNPA